MAPYNNPHGCMYLKHQIPKPSPLGRGTAKHFEVKDETVPAVIAVNHLSDSNSDLNHSDSDSGAPIFDEEIEKRLQEPFNLRKARSMNSISNRPLLSTPSTPTSWAQAIILQLWYQTIGPKRSKFQMPVSDFFNLSYKGLAHLDTAILDVFDPTPLASYAYQIIEGMEKDGTNLNHITASSIWGYGMMPICILPETVLALPLGKEKKREYYARVKKFWEGVPMVWKPVEGMGRLWKVERGLERRGNGFVVDDFEKRVKTLVRRKFAHGVMGEMVLICSDVCSDVRRFVRKSWGIEDWREVDWEWDMELREEREERERRERGETLDLVDDDSDDSSEDSDDSSEPPTANDVFFGSATSSASARHFFSWADDANEEAADNSRSNSPTTSHASDSDTTGEDEADQAVTEEELTAPADDDSTTSQVPDADSPEDKEDQSLTEEGVDVPAKEERSSVTTTSQVPDSKENATHQPTTEVEQNTLPHTASPTTLETTTIQNPKTFWEHSRPSFQDQGGRWIDNELALDLKDCESKEKSGVESVVAEVQELDERAANSCKSSLKRTIKADIDSAKSSPLKMRKNGCSN